MLQKILTFFQKEIVLSISAILAILSMFIVHPSGKYFSYIDFRTLSHLFCLMSIDYFCAPCNHYSKKNVRKAKELLDFKNGCYADNCRKSRQYADSHRKSPKSLFICQSQYICISTHPTHAALFHCSLGAASCVDTDCCA